jgi:hypothetical protein
VKPHQFHKGVSVLQFLAISHIIYGAINLIELFFEVSETWFLRLREEHKLRVFENKMLRKIFRPRRDRMTVGWTKLHNEELHNLYPSPTILRMIKSRRIRGWDMWHKWGQKRNVYKLLVGKPEGKRPLGRSRRRCLDNIKMDHVQIGLSVVDWIRLT